MPYDFSNLTHNQQELLSFGGWDRASFLRNQPSLSTVAELIQRGLLVEHPRRVAGDFPMTILEYEVPDPVHAAWREHCAERKG